MQHHAQAERLAQAMYQECVGIRVGRMQRLVGRTFENALRPVGVSLPQLEVLSALTGIGRPVKPTELAELLLLDRSTMSRNLTLMESKGWVSATETSPTGRSLAVQITPAGTVQLASAERAWRNAQKRVAASLGEDAARTMDSWLAALTSE